jgi:enamine deaminase RidA (YjgF/YER057c/UK114 family)
MEPGKPDFNYLPFKVHNNIVYLAGQLAKENGAVKNIGRVAESITEEEASRQMSPLCNTCILLVGNSSQE